MPAILNPAEMAALVAAITVLVSVVKPFLEVAVPPNAVMHDPLLRLLVFVLSLGSVLAVAIADNTFSGGNAVLLLSQAVIQAGASIGAYQVIARSGGATSSGPGVSLELPSRVAYRASVLPPIGPLPAFPPAPPAGDLGPDARSERGPVA